MPQIHSFYCAFLAHKEAQTICLEQRKKHNIIDKDSSLFVASYLCL